MEDTVNTNMKIQSLITINMCKLCSIYYRDTSHKYRHESTGKHIKKVSMFEKHISIERYQCDYCDKNYKYMSGLSRHKSKYHSNSIITSDHKDIMTIMKDILKTQMNILSKQEDNKTIIKNNIFNNNQVVNINVFLNEYCNKAVSLIDFINNLSLTVDDLKETKTLGYVEGVSNILVKKLGSLKPTERPIHCDDTKKNDLEFYIKDDSNWMKDIGNEKIDWSIENISKKQIEMLKIWEKSHPNWMKNEKETDTYMEMVKLCMGGSSPCEIEKNKHDIKKAIANGVKIEDILSL